MRCKTIMMMNKKLTLAESFTGAAHCEAVEIYEWVHLVVTLHSETQQVVILLCPPTTEAGASVYSGQITVDSGQWRKTGEQEGPIHAWSLPTRPNSMSNTQMHPGALKKKKRSPYFNANTNTLIQTVSVFCSPLIVWETEASEDNSSVTHIWARHRQTGRDPPFA